jgi:hypothetical protein
MTAVASEGVPGTRRLRDAGISHGALGADTIIVSDRGICVRSFRRASASAPASRLDTDLAAALAAMAVRAGALPLAAGSFHAPSDSGGDQAAVWIILAVILAAGIAATLAAILGGAVPVPGGLGVVEAGLIAGLTSAGIPQEQAVAAVLIQRFFTSYLPPVWGWATLAWMRRREYV